MKTVSDIKLFFHQELAVFYEKKEVEQLFDMICRDYFNFSKIDMMIGRPEVDLEQEEWLKNTVEELKKKRPIQQIIGFTYFHDLKFEVNEFTLIPRPETEELVQWILDDFSQGNGLDIGTGSGSIPITLASQNINMSAIDISGKAIVQAKKNAEMNQVEVDFQLCDILSTLPVIKEKLDFVVSNPPYVLESDKVEMSKNVLDFEPHLALFVSDDEALIFYERIALASKKLLKSSGKLYFEIHEDKSKEIVNLLNQLGYDEIEVKNDLQGKPRMVKANWK